MKKLAIGAGIVIALVVILALLPFAVDLNKHKGAILDHIRTVTARQVDFGSIRLTILTGLGAEITGLRIADDPAFSTGDFITLKRAKVKVAFLPMIRKEIKVRKVVLDEPRLSIIRNRRGAFNFKTLLIPRPEKVREGEAGPGALERLMVGDFEVKNGVLTYRDETSGPEAKPFTVSDIDLESSGISLARPIPFLLSAAVMSREGQNLNVKGTFGPMTEQGGLDRAPFDVQLLLDSAPLASLPVKMPFRSGDLKIDLKAQGDLKDRITAKMVVDLAGLVLDGPAGKEQKGISCTVTGDMDLEMERQTLSMRGGTFSVGPDRGTFEGRVDGLRKAPAWDIKVSSKGITAGPILAQLPVFAGLIPEKLTLKGPASFTLVTTGNKQAFELKTTVDMRPMAITFGKFFNKAANSPFTFTSFMVKRPEVMEIASLDLDLGAIRAKGAGDVRKAGGKSLFQVRIDTNPVPLQTAQALIPMLQAFRPSGNVVVKTVLNGGGGGPLSVKVQASSARMGLVLTRPKEGVQPKARVLAGPAKADMNAVSIAVDALKKGKALTAQGSMKSRGGTFMEIPYATLTSSFSLADDHLRVTSFDLTALKGSIRGSASYNLKSKAWTAAPVFNNVQAGTVLDTLTSFKGVFAGTVTGDLKASGIAGAPALNSLGARGRIAISKGEWKNFDLAGTVLGSILGVPGASEVFGFAPAEVQRYNTTRFESMDTEVDLAKKVIAVDTMRLLNITSGRDVDTESSLKGTISMETNEVNLKGTVVLPKRFSQRIGNRAEAFSAIMNDQRRLVLPMTITGSLKKPIPMVEVRALSSAFTKYYTTKALDKGMKRLQDRGKLPPGGEETRKVLEDTLEGLFKKK
jgi:uncharacterized protein involved in outer membrane biogenesis